MEYRLIFRESITSPVPESLFLSKPLATLCNISEISIYKDCFSLLRRHFSMMHAQFMALVDLPVFYLRACLYTHLPPSTTQSV